MGSVFERRSAAALTPLRALGGLALDQAIAAFIPCALGPGEVLMEPGDGEHPTLLVMDGALSMSAQGRPPVRLLTLGQGDVLGGGSLHGGEVTATRLITESDCRVLLLDRDGADWLRRIDHPALDALQRAALSAAVGALRGAAGRLASAARLPDDPVTAVAPTPSLLSRLSERLGPRLVPPQPELLLARSPVFQQVDAVARGWLADRLEARPLSDQVIQVERSASTGVWFVAEGALELRRDVSPRESVRLAILEPGAILGLPGIVDGGPALVSAAALGRGWAYHLPPEAAEALLKSPEARPLRRALLAHLSARLRRASDGLSEVTLQLRREGTVDPSALWGTSAALWSTHDA